MTKLNLNTTKNMMLKARKILQQLLVVWNNLIFCLIYRLLTTKMWDAKILWNLGEIINLLKGNVCEQYISIFTTMKLI